VLRPGVDAFALPAITLRSASDGSRLLAARLLERNLLRIGRAGTLVDRRLAPGLQRLRLRRLYRLLGYVRLGDCLTERLGMSLRRCQAILRLERVVESLPGLGRALQAGEVSLSKVETVAGGATAATEAFWLERARRLTVAGLREETRAARAVGDPAAGTVKSEVCPVPPAGETIEQDEPGRLVSFSAPTSVVGVWHWTLDLVRRVAGQQEPAWRCAEYLAAEFLSGVPDRSSGGAGAPSTDVPPGASASAVAASSDASGMAAWIEACDAVRDALASIGTAADLDAILSGPPAGGGDDELDAWELDAHLRRLVRLRQSLAWRQGRLLATFASLRLHRELGFGSLDDWIGDRLPMSPRRARYLISLDRRLRGLPLVADAYRRGLVSWCHTRLLVRIVAPATQSRWIRYARQVTVRRLEDAVIACEVEAAEAANIGASPLPPADPPSLHTSAPRPDGAQTRTAPLGRQASRRIAFWAPLDVAALWDSALRACRDAAGTRLDDWECFLLFVQALRDTWDNADDPQWKRRYRIFERDGWRCMAPGCTSRSGLNEHHIIFRSQQGNDADDNLVTLCIGHHQEGLHANHLRCVGRAPDSLWWDLGIRPGGEPLVSYFGERVVTHRARVPLPARAEAGAA
jgi:hypothetical protein